MLQVNVKTLWPARDKHLLCSLQFILIARGTPVAASYFPRLRAEELPDYLIMKLKRRGLVMRAAGHCPAAL